MQHGSVVRCTGRDLGHALLHIILIGALPLFAVGLAYFIFLGVRAIYRDASQTAREAGHSQVGARVRATIRMSVWAAFFGAFYSFLYFLGKRIGWWAVAPGLAGGLAMIFSLLQADRLLTIPRTAARQQIGIAVTIALALAMLISITWFAAQSD